MKKDPRNNSLVEISAREIVLNGKIDVLENSPIQIYDNNSSTLISIDNPSSAFVQLITAPKAINQISAATASYGEQTIFHKGFGPSNYVGNSEFMALEPNYIVTFDNSSGLDDRFYTSGSQSGTRAAVDWAGRSPDNDLNYKNIEFRNALDVNWSGRVVESLIPYTLTPSYNFALYTGNYQKILSPDASNLWQTGTWSLNLPIQNLWDSEVIWDLRSGSGDYTGDRVGRAMESGSSYNAAGTVTVPSYEIYSTGSTVASVGSRPQYLRFLEGGAIRDNSATVTMGGHFRPDNRYTKSSSVLFKNPTGIKWAQSNFSQNENSGRLLLGAKNKLLFPEVIETIDPTIVDGSAFIFNSWPDSVVEKQSTMMKFRTADLVETDFEFNSYDLLGVDNYFTSIDSVLAGLVGDAKRVINSIEGFVLKCDVSTVKREYSLNILYDCYLYSFENLGFAMSPDEYQAFVPQNGEIYLGDPFKLYFSEDYLIHLNIPYQSLYGIRKFSNVQEVILLTSQGQIFLKRDLGLTLEELQNKKYIDIGKQPFAYNSEKDKNGIFNTYNPLNLTADSRIRLFGIIALYEKNTSAALVYDNLILQYYKVPRKKYLYNNSHGHKAHDIYNDPYAYIVKGDVANPKQDPQFRIINNNENITSLGYVKGDEIIPAIQKKGGATLYAKLYNPQYGEPIIDSSRPKQISNINYKPKSYSDIESSSSFKFKNALDTNMSSRALVPFFMDGLYKEYAVQVVNAEGEKNVKDAGFIDDKIVPIVPFSNNGPSGSLSGFTDILGNVFLTDVPTEYTPVYDKNGNIDSLYGSSIKLRSSKFENNNFYNSEDSDKTIEVNLLKAIEKFPGMPIQYGSKNNIGYLPYNDGNSDKIGVMFRVNYMSNPANIDDQFYKIEQFPRQAIPTSNPKTNGQPASIPLNRNACSASYFGQPYLNLPIGIDYRFFSGSGTWGTTDVFYSPFNILHIYGDKLLNYLTSTTEYSNEKLFYEKSYMYYSDVTNKAHPLDSDSGKISGSIEKSTRSTNSFNIINSEVYTFDDGINQKFGNFISSDNEISRYDSENFYTGSIKVNYFYDDVPNIASNILIINPGYINKTIDTKDFSAREDNKLLLVKKDVNKLKIKEFNNKRNSKLVEYFTGTNYNSLAPACYCHSDTSALYDKNCINSYMLYSFNQYAPTVPAKIPVSPVPFFNIPLSGTSAYYSATGGESSQALAYMNFRNNTSRFFTSAWFNYNLPDNTNKRYAVHPKSINYSIDPPDTFFGTAFIDSNQSQRQITRFLNFKLEHALYHDDYSAAGTSDALTSSYIDNGFTNQETWTPGIMAGTYNYIFRIQDMILPAPRLLYSGTAATHPNQQPPLLFEPYNSTNPNDNGLRSNFYFNINECEIDKSLFLSITEEIKTNFSYYIKGIVSTVTSGNSLNMTYGTGSLEIIIDSADDVVFKTKNPISGTDQYRGVFLPDPARQSLGRDKLNIEGGISSLLENGEFAQPFKNLRITMFSEDNIKINGLTNFAKLAVSFRPNSQIPSNFLEEDGGKYSIYPNEEYAQAFQMYNGEYFCFARISSFGSYHSLNERYDPKSFGEFNVLSSYLKTSNSIKKIETIPYDPFAHEDPIYYSSISNFSFIDCLNVVDNTAAPTTGSGAFTMRAPLGYHSILSLDEDAKELQIGHGIKSSLYTASDSYQEIDNGVNRSIIDQGMGINIIQIAGMARK